MSSEPAVRANWVRLIVGRIKRLPPAQAEPILDRLGEPYRARQRGRGALEWLPLSEFLLLFEAIEHCHGEEFSIEFWTGAMLDSYGRFVLKPLVKLAIHMGGRTPHSFLKYTGRAWDTMTSNCAKVRYQTNHAQTRFELDFLEIAEEARNCPALTHLWIGNVQAAAAFLETPLVVATDDSAWAKGRFHMVVTMAEER